jgi:hypothetical protein
MSPTFNSAFFSRRPCKAVAQGGSSEYIKLSDKQRITGGIISAKIKHIAFTSNKAPRLARFYESLFGRTQGLRTAANLAQVPATSRSTNSPIGLLSTKQQHLLKAGEANLVSSNILPAGR